MTNGKTLPNELHHRPRPGPHPRGASQQPRQLVGGGQGGGAEQLPAGCVQRAALGGEGHFL